MSKDVFPHSLKGKTFTKEDFITLCASVGTDPIMLDLLSESMKQGVMGNTLKVHRINCHMLNRFYGLTPPEGFIDIPLDSIPTGCAYPNMSETIASHLGASMKEGQVTIVTVTCFNDITEPVEVMIPPTNVMTQIIESFGTYHQVGLVSIYQNPDNKFGEITQKPLSIIASYKPDSMRNISLDEYYDFIFANSPEGTRERFNGDLTPANDMMDLKSPEQIVQEAIARQTVSKVPLGDLKEVIETEVSDVQQKEDS